MKNWEEILHGFSDFHSSAYDKFTANSNVSVKSENQIELEKDLLNLLSLFEIKDFEEITLENISEKKEMILRTIFNMTSFCSSNEFVKSENFVAYPNEDIHSYHGEYVDSPHANPDMAINFSIRIHALVMYVCERILFPEFVCHANPTAFGHVVNSYNFGKLCQLYLKYEKAYFRGMEGEEIADNTFDIAMTAFSIFQKFKQLPIVSDDSVKMTYDAFYFSNASDTLTRYSDDYSVHVTFGRWTLMNTFGFDISIYLDPLIYMRGCIIPKEHEYDNSFHRILSILTLLIFRGDTYAGKLPKKMQLAENDTYDVSLEDFVTIQVDTKEGTCTISDTTIAFIESLFAYEKLNELYN